MPCSNIYIYGGFLRAAQCFGQREQECGYPFPGRAIITVRRFDSQLAGALKMPLKRSDELRCIDLCLDRCAPQADGSGASILRGVRDVTCRSLEVWQLGSK